MDDYRSHNHYVCWTPGTYPFHLFSAKESGWVSGDRLSVMDETGVLTEFQLPSDAMKVSRLFTWEYVVSEHSEWKMKRGSMDKKWTRVKYNDKKWENGHDGVWGSFSKDVTSIFFPRSFSLDASKFTFLHLNIKRSDDCEVIAHLNEKEIPRLSGPPLSNQHLYPSVEIRRSKDAGESAPIEFDALVSYTSSNSIIQSVNGVASSDQSTHDQTPYAFDFKNN